MRKYIAVTFLTVIIGSLGAADNSRSRDAGFPPMNDILVDHLLRRGGPGRPEIVGGTVIFTASSSYRRVGIAFAREGFGKVYWFRKFMIPNENPSPWIKDKPPADMYVDSGILFHVFTVPEDLGGKLEYRLVMDGLWAQDPLNPDCRTDSSGIVRSVLSIPGIRRPDSPGREPEGALNFTFYAESGGTVSVAGSFNNWDPFMYELRETGPGRYTLSLPLPPGTYQYCFFYRGERILDPDNPRRIYTRDGKGASEAEVKAAP